MRLWFTAFFALALASEANAAGAYLSSPTRDSAACARLCADDGLCIAWSYTAEGACQLRANAPEGPSGIASGVSARAPGTLRQAFVNHAPAVAPSPAPAAPESAAAAAVAPIGDDSADAELLGGPSEAATAPTLRLGLRN
jgi:hypothetical protein